MGDPANEINAPLAAGITASLAPNSPDALLADLLAVNNVGDLYHLLDTRVNQLQGANEIITDVVDHLENIFFAPYSGDNMAAQLTAVRDRITADSLLNADQKAALVAKIPADGQLVPPTELSDSDLALIQDRDWNAVDTWVTANVDAGQVGGVVAPIADGTIDICGTVYQRMSASANNNNCLPHSLLTALSARFRALPQDGKDTVADMFRTHIMFKIVDQTFGQTMNMNRQKSRYRNLTQGVFLTDVDLGTFLTRYTLLGLVKEGDTYSLFNTAAAAAAIAPTNGIFLANQGGGHYEPVRKQDGENYIFASDVLYNIFDSVPHREAGAPIVVSSSSPPRGGLKMPVIDLSNNPNQGPDTSAALAAALVVAATALTASLTSNATISGPKRILQPLPDLLPPEAIDESRAQKHLYAFVVLKEMPPEGQPIWKLLLLFKDKITVPYGPYNDPTRIESTIANILTRTSNPDPMPLGFKELERSSERMKSYYTVVIKKPKLQINGTTPQGAFGKIPGETAGPNHWWANLNDAGTWLDSLNDRMMVNTIRALLRALGVSVSYPVPDWAKKYQNGDTCDSFKDTIKAAVEYSNVARAIDDPALEKYLKLFERKKELMPNAAAYKRLNAINAQLSDYGSGKKSCSGKSDAPQEDADILKEKVDLEAEKAKLEKELCDVDPNITSELAAIQEQLDAYYGDHPIIVHKGRDSREPNRMLHVVNPYAAAMYREETTFATPQSVPGKKEKIYDPAGEMRKKNMQVLNAVVPKELIADKKMAISILESLWYCGTNPSVSNDPRCFPSRFLGELRDLTESKIQRSTVKSNKTQWEWPMIKKILLALKSGGTKVTFPEMDYIIADGLPKGVAPFGEPEGEVLAPPGQQNPTPGPGQGPGQQNPTPTPGQGQRQATQPAAEKTVRFTLGVPLGGTTRKPVLPLGLGGMRPMPTN